MMPFFKQQRTRQTFPGGATCTFRGKEVSCLKKWSPKGSITSEIIIATLATLDDVGCIDCTDGQTLFLLEDGHGRRFQPNFLQYVIDPTHEWFIWSGVTYGTAMWQVSDLSKQNEV